MGKVLSWLTQKFGIKSEHQQYKQQVMSETAIVDFSAITHDWEKSKRLYDILKKKCHPDLYTGEQNEKATRLFQMLMEKKYNYTELLKIKELAVKELETTIP
jgi:hypothetical protein